MKISNKVNKQDMDKIDYSTDKNSTLDIKHAQDKYLGGDNDVFEGFYNSEEELDFENFKKKGKKG